MKHPVPKQKQSKSRSNRRYKMFQNITRKKLANRVNLVSCPHCKAFSLLHHVCPKCGTYRGKNILGIIKTAQKKVNTIKAE